MRLFCTIRTDMSGTQMTQANTNPAIVKDRLDPPIYSDASSVLCAGGTPPRELLVRSGPLPWVRVIEAIRRHIELSVPYASYKRLPLKGSEH